MSAVTDLGRRSLTEIFEITAKNKSELVSCIAEIISKRKPNLTERELQGRAVSTLVMMTEMATFGMVLRMSYSIGSDRLTPIYDRYFEGKKNPVMRLVLAALHLDHFEHFPESLLKELSAELHDNPVAFCILRQMVVRHFHIFPTDFRLRQRLGALLKIDYQNIAVQKKEQQLIQN